MPSDAKDSTHQPARSCEIRFLTIRPGASQIKGVRVPEVAGLSPAHTQYAIPKEAGSRWECTLVSSKTPAQPHIPAERTAHWGIFSQSKAKDFRMCYFGFIATRKPAARLRRPHTGRREMTSKPCKSLKKDGAPCRGSGFDQLDGYCIANAPAPSCPPPPVCHHAPKTFSQSLANSRNLSSNAPASLRSVDTSKNWTKRRLLQVACGKNPTAIRPVPMHEARDLRRRR